MWLKKMKNQKRQLLLTGLMLFAVAGLLNMSLSLIGELAMFSRDAINEANCPDAYIFTIGTSEFADHFADDGYQDEVERVAGLRGKAVTAPIRYQGRDITQLYDMMLTAEDWQDFSYFELMTEGLSPGPAAGEVWLAEVLTKPNNIRPGDTVVIEYPQPVELTVSGVYRSSCFPKGIGYSPMIVHPDTLVQAAGAKDAVLFAVDIRDYSNGQLKELFQDSAYSVATRSRDDVRSSLMEYSAPLGAIGAMAAFTIFLVAMVVIWHIIKNNLLKEYRTIGVYKSLGYRAGEIAGFYRTGYLIVALVSVTLGALSALVLVNLIGRLITEYVEGFTISGVSYAVSAATILVLMLLLNIHLHLVFRNVKTITPVEAIHVGTTRLEQNLPKPLLRYAKTPLAMAVNEIFKYRRTSAMMALALSVSMFLTMFFQMIWYSADTILEHRNLWFCLPQSDLYVAGAMSGELQEYLNENPDVKSAVYGDFMIGYCRLEGYSDIPVHVGYDAYSSFEEEITGVRMLEGRGPAAAGEVAVGRNLLGTLGATIGDPVEFTINGNTKSYTISGIYKTISDSGRKIMLTTDAVSACKDYTASRAYVQLHRPGDYARFKQDVEQRFGGVTVDKSWFAMENSVDSIKGMLKSISMLLMCSFLVFSVLNMLIVLLIDLRNWRRKYGILKSLGFDTGYMIRQNLCKYLLIGFAGVMISLVLHLLVSRRMAALMLLDAFVNSALLIGVILVCFVGLIALTTYLMSLSMKHISPLELMEE